MNEQPPDVLVIGGGNAALCAALTARQAGASVTVLERAPRHFRGGNSRHTRNFRCAHAAPTTVLTDAYPEDEFLADLNRVTEAQGDAARGQALVEGRGGCLVCHAIEVAGGLVAPDLSDIGSRRRSGELRDSLLDPNAEVRTENRFVDAHLTGGPTVRGRLLNQDSFSVQILSMDERLTAISKSDLEELEFIDSPMPSFRDRLTPQELNDVVRYLTTLR